MTVRNRVTHRLIAAWSVLVACPVAGAQTTQPAGRSDEAIHQEMQQCQLQLKALITGPDVLSDPAQRAAVAPRAIPPLRTLIADFEEVGVLHPEIKPRMAGAVLQDRAFLAALGDQPTIDLFQRQADGKDEVESLQGHAGQLLARWTQAGGDAGRQGPVLDDVASLDAAHPTSVQMTALTVMLANSAKTPQVRQRARDLVSAMHNPLADRLRQSTTRP